MSRQSAPSAPAALADAAPFKSRFLHEHDFATLLMSMQDTLDEAHHGGRRIFTTAAADLFDIYLNSCPTDRQYHNCHACRSFVERFGGLVCINADGTTDPIMWQPQRAPGFYHHAAKALRSKVVRARVTGQFLTSEPRLGTPVTNAWEHLAVSVPVGMRHRHDIDSAEQAIAKKAMDHQTVMTALQRFDIACLDTALGILEAEALPQSERFVEPVRFLRDIHAGWASAGGAQARNNILWRAVASAPDGFCHPTTSMTGSLLEDIANRYAFDDIRRRFSAKMAPLKFQRPQAPPAAGTVAEAERIVDAMRLRPALKRRYARLEDLRPSWVPAPRHTPAPVAPGSVFGHLRTKNSPAPLAEAVAMPPRTLTWEKFAREVLPAAEGIDLMVPYGSTRFIALTTAEDPSAPPLLKWDRPEERNPVGWYIYPGGSSASQWGLIPGIYARVNAVVPLPTMWGSRPMPHEGDGAVLVLEACRERAKAPLCLFPSFLRSELHPVRSVIEAYSNAGILSGSREATACGFDVRHSGEPVGITLRVRRGTTVASYVIDRWN